MDGLSWKSLLKMDDLGGTPPIFGNIHMEPENVSLEKEKII